MNWQSCRDAVYFLIETCKISLHPNLPEFGNHTNKESYYRTFSAASDVSVIVKVLSFAQSTSYKQRHGALYWTSGVIRSLSFQFARPSIAPSVRYA